MIFINKYFFLTWCVYSQSQRQKIHWSVFGCSTIALQHCPHPSVHACAEGVKVVVAEIVPDPSDLQPQLLQGPGWVPLQFPLDKSETVLDGIQIWWLSREEDQFQLVAIEKDLRLFSSVDLCSVLDDHRVVLLGNSFGRKVHHPGVLLRVHHQSRLKEGQETRPLWLRFQPGQYTHNLVNEQHSLPLFLLWKCSLYFGSLKCSQIWDLE